MSVYDVSLLLKLRLRAASETEAEDVLALLVRALEGVGTDVTIEGFEELRDATHRVTLKGE